MSSLSCSVSLLTFCLVALSIVGRGVLKPPTTTVGLSISPFYPISIFASHALLLLFCAYIWDCFVFLVDWPFVIMYVPLWASHVALVVKNLPATAGDMRAGFNPWVRRAPWRRAWQAHSSVLTWRMPRTEEPGKYSPEGCTESDTTKAPWHTCFTLALLNFFALMSALPDINVAPVGFF